MAYFLNPKAKIENSRAKRVHIVNGENYTRDWCFWVPLPAFMGALDLQWSVWKIPCRDSETGEILKDSSTGKTLYDTYGLITQAATPRWAFAFGDVFHTVNLANCSWPAQPDGRSLQVKKADGDRLEIAHHDWFLQKKLVISLTQKGLAELLKNGFKGESL